MSFTKERKIDILEQFVGGRYIDEDTIKLFSDKFERVEDTIYRGMPFPKHLIKEGFIVEEWHGSSHWSLDFNVSREVFSKDKFNISEDYCGELALELGLSYDEVYDNVFVPVVFELNGVSSGIRLYNIVKDLDLVSRFYKEKEITTIGIDTKIKSFEKKYDSCGGYYLIKVEEILKS